MRSFHLGILKRHFRPGLSTLDGEEAPDPRHTLEFIRASILHDATRVDTLADRLDASEPWDV
jgi:hypothetical protein